MKYVFLMLAALLLNVETFSQVSFNRIYGTNYREECFDVIKLVEGNYLVSGITAGYGAESESFFLHLDEQGSILSTIKLFGVNNEHFDCIVELGNGNIAAGGGTSSYGFGGTTAWIFVMSLEGQLIWSKTIQYGSTVRDMKIDEEGNLHLAIQNQNNLLLLLKMTPDGNVIQNKLLSAAIDYGYLRLATTSENGIVVCCRNDGNNGFMVMKLDEEYNILWNNTFWNETQNYTRTADLSVNEEDEIFILGDVQTLGIGGTDILAVKLNALGETLWSKGYGGLWTDDAAKGLLLQNGGYAITGTTQSTGSGSHDFFLLELNASGTPQWAKTYGKVWSDKARSIDHGQEEGYIVAGNTLTQGVNIDSTEIVIFKTLSDGSTVCNSTAWNIANVTIDIPILSSKYEYSEYDGILQDEIIPISIIDFHEKDFCLNTGLNFYEEEESILIQPNPASANFTVNWEKSTWSTLEFYDITGRIVKSIPVYGLNRLEVNSSEMSSGMYLLKLIDVAGSTKIQRLVIE